MLPSMARPGQRIRLPGQTRVMHDEYKEFLNLGHGDIFDLDPDLCVLCSPPHPQHCCDTPSAIVPFMTPHT